MYSCCISIDQHWSSYYTPSNQPEAIRSHKVFAHISLTVKHLWTFLILSYAKSFIFILFSIQLYSQPSEELVLTLIIVYPKSTPIAQWFTRRQDGNLYGHLGLSRDGEGALWSSGQGPAHLIVNKRTVSIPPMPFL